MKWNEYYDALKNGIVEPVYVFMGKEEYVKREAWEALRAKLLPAGLEALNEAILEGVTAQQITDAAETLPMMADRRLVTVRDWAPLMEGKAANEQADVEWMTHWLDNPPDTCALVFYLRNGWDAKKKLPAVLKKKACVVEFDELTGADLSRWCAQYLKPSGKKIGKKALGTLTFMVGNALSRLIAELDKLAAYVGERAEITEEDVRAIASTSLEYTAFKIIDNLLSGDRIEAQKIINNLLEGGQSPTGILAMLTSQLRRLTHVKCAVDAGEPLIKVQKLLGSGDYAIKIAARQSSVMSSNQLIALFQRAVALDYAIKSGRRRDREALDEIFDRIYAARRH